MNFSLVRLVDADHDISLPSGRSPYYCHLVVQKRLKEKGKRAEKEDGEVEKRKNGFSAIDVKFFIPELFLDR